MSSISAVAESTIRLAITVACVWQNPEKRRVGGMSLHEVKCRNCSAPLKIRGGILKCAYCESEFSSDLSFGFLSLSKKFDDGMWDECIVLSSNRLQTNGEDIEARYYRGLSRLFSRVENYLEYDKMVLNLIENSTTPVGEEKLIHTDLKNSFKHDNYYNQFLVKIGDRINERKKFANYRRDLEARIMKHIKEIGLKSPVSIT